MDTNYTSAFILVSPDTKVTAGTVPANPSSVAGHQYELLSAAPYKWTSDEFLFEVYARRHSVTPDFRDRAWKEFSAKSHACLRASPLVKSFGWGIHHDHESKIALVGMETERYRELAGRSDLEIRLSLRSSREA